MPNAGARKTFAEGDKELRRPADANLSAKERPNQAAFLRQEAEPGLAIRGDPEIGRADVTIVHAYGGIPNDEGRLALFIAGKREMIGCLQVPRLIGLKHEG